ncbi:MAG TPA: WD40 repeat domain-containing protein [Pseudonocardiaceae bacterium]
MIEHSSPISGIDVNKSYVATAGYDNKVILWDAESHTSLADVRHDHLANQCRFAPSGRLLATSGSDFSARIWTIPDLRLVTVLTDQKDDVEMTVISPDETMVATVSRDHHVRVYSIDGVLRYRMEGHQRDVLSVEWVADGRELVTTSDDSTVRRWDVQRGELLHTTDLGDVETDTVAVIDDGEVLVLGNDDGNLVIIEYDQTPRLVEAHGAGIKRVVFDREQQRLLSSSYDRTVRLWQWNPERRELELRITSDVPAEVWLRSCAKLDETRWAFGTFGTSYAVWDSATDTWDLAAVRPTHGVNAVARSDGATLTVGDAGIVSRAGEPVAYVGSCCNFLCPVGSRWVTGGQLGIVYDALSGAALHQHRSPLNCAATFPGADGNPRLVVGTYTGEGLVFRLDGERLEFEREVPLHDNAIKDVAVSAEVLFSVSATGSAGFHAIPDLTVIHHEESAHDRICNGAAVLHDGRFASVSRDLTLRIWSAQGERLAVVPTPHEHSIKCVTTDPTGRFVATGGYRGRVAVYDSGDGEAGDGEAGGTEQWVLNERVASAGVSSLCPGDEPGTVIAGSYDGRTYEIRASSR